MIKGEEMRFILNSDNLVEMSDENIDSKEILVLNEAEYDKEIKLSEYKKIRRKNLMIKDIHYCRMEVYKDFIYANMRIPALGKREESLKIAFFMDENRICFVDNSDTVVSMFKNMKVRKIKNEHTLETFLDEFLLSLIDEDYIYLNELEKRISILEEEVVDRRNPEFNKNMIDIKKSISSAYRYYNQLSDFIQDLISFVSSEENYTYRILESKVERLLQESIDIREYANQVQDLYMSEITIKQNDVMKILTVVTTIFLPLTLIAGWYGMNFENMPELSWEYGYLSIIIVSVFVAVIGIVIFKIKKMF
jgi:magnesium transporter